MYSFAAVLSDQFIWYRGVVITPETWWTITPLTPKNFVRE